MKHLATTLTIAAFTASTFAQGKVKLGAHFSDLIAGGRAVTSQPAKPGITITPARSEVRAQLAPPSKDNGLDSRGEGVPEPASIAALSIGIGAFLRRRKRA